MGSQCYKQASKAGTGIQAVTAGSRAALVLGMCTGTSMGMGWTQLETDPAVVALEQELMTLGSACAWPQEGCVVVVRLDGALRA